MTKIKNLIFDLDNTLYDFSTIWEKSNKQVYEYLKYDRIASYDEFFKNYKAINNMQCTDELTKDIFKRRYIHLESWEEISNKLNQPLNSILIFHNSYLYFIEL